jgi:hypothetical protein
MNTSAHIDEEVHGNVLELHLHGKLTQEDYRRFLPETERLIARHGKIRVLLIIHDFHGWQPSAVLAAIRWNHRHFRQIERLAVVGDTTITSDNVSGAFDLAFTRTLHWQKWLANFARPFVHAQVRYFPLDQLDAASKWLTAPADRQ